MHTYRPDGDRFRVVFMAGNKALTVRYFAGDEAESDAASYTNFLNGGAGGTWHGFRT